MGSGVSTQTVEVSFIDKETGKILPEKDIHLLTKAAEELVFNDFHPSFYDAYKNPENLRKMSEYYNCNRNMTHISSNIHISNT